jgi:hypothetical protein
MLEDKVSCIVIWPSFIDVVADLLDFCIIYGRFCVQISIQRQS